MSVLRTGRGRSVEERAELDLIAQLYEEYGAALFGFALKYTQDRDRAAEVVQDVMVRAWSNPDRVHPRTGSPKAWLFTVARRLCTDEYRRQSVRLESPVDDEVLSAVSIQAAIDDDVFGRMIEAWHMEAALSRLSSDHRSVIESLYYEGRTMAEVAQRLGVPQGTVKSRAYYAVRALRAALAEMGVQA